MPHCLLLLKDVVGRRWGMTYLLSEILQPLLNLHELVGMNSICTRSSFSHLSITPPLLAFLLQLSLHNWQQNSELVLAILIWFYFNNISWSPPSAISNVAPTPSPRPDLPGFWPGVKTWPDNLLYRLALVADLSARLPEVTLWCRPLARTATRQKRAFSIVDPSVWNSLPSGLCSLPGPF